MTPDTQSQTINVVVLGSTGSIGTQALEVVRDHPERFNVVGLAAGGSNLGLLAHQIREFRPKAVAVADPGGSQANGGRGQSPELSDLQEFARLCRAELVFGADSVASIAGAFPDATVLNGINGGVGLASTLAALSAGCTLALANKESLVVGAPIVKQAIQRPAQVVPVDSEHSAIAQALLAGKHHRGMVSSNADGESDLREIVLTASGGPFRGKTRGELKDVTAKQALAHPTWTMGPVVTVNSSTLMNKGLELIEAAVLFDVAPERIIPVVHPQSIVHSMVTWNDGSTIAQAGYPNMKVPIALGMDWPNHQNSVGVPMGWDKRAEWTFEPVDDETFPALKLARACLNQSATHPAVMNAANEVCVNRFLEGQLSYLGIMDTVTQIVEEHDGNQNPSLEDILEAQSWAFDRAAQLIATAGGNR